MLVVNYNGNKPISNYYKFGVEGNNNTDIVRFVVLTQQGQLDLSNNFKVYVKCQNDNFLDKVEIDENNIDYFNNNMVVDWYMLRKHTEQSTLEVSLCFEKNNDVWQTQCFTLRIMNGIVADDKIANDYPTILQQLERQISELSGGAGSVEIEKIYLENDDKNYRYEAGGKMVWKDSDGNPYYNNANNIKVCVQTTPISETIYQEIVNGRFVIRFNYPVRGRKRGFTNFLSGNQANKLRAIYFVDVDDVITTSYGERYILMKEKFVDFFNRFFTFEDEYSGDLPAFEGFSYEDSALNQALWEYNVNDDYMVAGVQRNSDDNSYEWSVSGAILNRYTNKNGYKGCLNDTSNGILMTPRSWKDKKHNAWCPLKVYDDYSTLGNGANIKEKTPFALKNKTNKWKYRKFIQDGTHSFNDGLWFYYINDFAGNLTINNYISKVSLRPSCAILDLNYASMDFDENCWLKTFKQSEQTIILKANAMFGLVLNNAQHDGYIYTIGQVRVSHKKA